MRISFTLPIVLALLAGCQQSNTGEIDYRVADIAGSGFLATSDQLKLAPGEDACDQEDEKACYGERPVYLFEMCEGAACERDFKSGAEEFQLRELSDRHILPDDATLIGKGDPYKVRLMTVFLSDDDTPESFFSEFGLSAASLGEMNKQLVKGKKNLEVTFLANAVDLNPDGTDKARSYDSLGDARVVYYSSDIYTNQFLNIDNVELLGPTKFNGVGLRLTLAMIEMDSEGKRQAELLEKIAGLGKFVLPAATGPIQILNSIGGSLLGDSDRNDTLFRYDNLYDAAGKASVLQGPVLKPGNYVFIRDEDRQQNIPWKELVIDINTKRLYRCQFNSADDRSIGASSCFLFTNQTYVVLQIDRADVTAIVDIAQQSFQDFEQALKDEGLGTGMAAAIDEMMTDLTKASSEGEAIDDLQSARAAQRRGVALMRKGERLKEAGKTDEAKAVAEAAARQKTSMKSDLVNFAEALQNCDWDGSDPNKLLTKTACATLSNEIQDWITASYARRGSNAPGTLASDLSAYAPTSISKNLATDATSAGNWANTLSKLVWP